MTQIRRILCPVDFSEFSQRAVDHAVSMAAWYKAPLTFMYVFVNRPAMDVPPIELTAADRERFTNDLMALVRHAAPSGPVDYLVTEASDVHREILVQAEAVGANLLVVGSHGRSGFERLRLGSVTEKVIRKAHCPVMVVPRGAPDVAPGSPVRFTRILCPVDFSEGSVRALNFAVSIAGESGGHLTLVHVIEIPPELREHVHVTSALDVDQLHAAAEAAALQRMRELVSPSAHVHGAVETEVREGAAYRQILAVAADRAADLIVMGVEGRGALDLLVFGSNTARVIRGATCPVVIVGRERGES